ncbi:hypoxanthine phosphoribosyltransferase [bacterium]|nr:hypoxanthine phosphoribosyltransferase [bacterium]
MKEKLLIPREKIEKRIEELGIEISKDYLEKEVILVCILKGAVYFAIDLTRHLSIPFVIDFMAISKYSGSSSGVVRITKDLDVDIYQRDVIVVEDIVDTGLTLGYLLKNLKARSPLSLKVCTLLDCPSRRIVDIPVDYRGFEIPDVFVVGYGLDYKERYRNLLDIVVLEE